MRFPIALTVLSLTLFLGACTSAPIADVGTTTVSSITSSARTRDQVRDAITRAGTGLGWIIKEESPGILVGTLKLRDHTAVVEIPYSATSYSIKYRSSINLNEKSGNIHKNYNSWVQNLDRAIRVQLS